MNSLDLFHVNDGDEIRELASLGHVLHFTQRIIDQIPCHSIRRHLLQDDALATLEQISPQSVGIGGVEFLTQDANAVNGTARQFLKGGQMCGKKRSRLVMSCQFTHGRRGLAHGKLFNELCDFSFKARPGGADKFLQQLREVSGVDDGFINGRFTAGLFAKKSANELGLLFKSTLH